MLELWDIDKELNELIFKYNIDKPFPNYRRFVKAYEIFKDLYIELQKKNTRLIFVSESKTDLKWVQSCICSREEQMLEINMANPPYVTIDNEATYINVSQIYREEIQLMLCQKSASVISIYNLFEQNGIYFQNVFYDIYGEEYLPFRGNVPKKDWENFDICHLFFNHRRCFETAQEDAEKELYLKKLIFDCVFARDFLMLETYVGKFEGTQKRVYNDFYTECMMLIRRIKEKLAEHREDVLILWLDALEYGEDAEMAYLKEIEETAVTFANAYTVTPYTGPTFKTLFTSKRTVEEESFRLNKVTEQDGEFWKELDKLGYSFKYYGELTLLERDKRGGYFLSYYTAISQLYWYIVRDLLLGNSDKGVYVLHEMLQTHAPYISLGILGNEYWAREAWPGQQHNVISQKKQALESRSYLDRQLRFFGELLPESMKKIYLSDHGHTYFGRFHVILKVQCESLKPCLITNLFSYVDFSAMLLELIRTGSIDERYLSREYVWVQDVDYYNKEYIHTLVERCNFPPDSMFGYQGIITEKDMLLKYNHGSKFYLKHNNDEIMVTDDRLEYLEALMSKKRINVWEEEKFEASRLLYTAWSHSSVRYEKQEADKQQILLELFGNINRNEITAIRGGGMHSLRLLMLLPYELREKIDYIIDTNQDCVASRLGIKVISPSEISDYRIRTIIISSLFYRELWKEELKEFKGKIIDFYMDFEKRGIDISHDFFVRKFLPQDFNLDS